jgi:hypothetical protein
MRVQGLVVPVLLVVMLLASACMPLESVIVSSTGGPSTPVESFETAVPEATPTPPPAPDLATVEAAATAGAASAEATTGVLPAPEATVVVTSTLPVPISETPASTGTTEAPAIATPVTGTLPITPTVDATMPELPELSVYQDEVGGYTLEYPVEWFLVDVDPAIKRESVGYSVTITSWTPQEPGGQGIPQGGSKIDIGVTKGANSAEEAIEARRAELAASGGGEIVFEEPWELTSGLNAAHLVIQPPRALSCMRS